MPVVNPDLDAPDPIDIPVIDPDPGNTDLTDPSSRGPSREFYLILIALVSSLLTSYFGHDWGLSKNAQSLATLAVFVLPSVYAIAVRIEKAFFHRAQAQTIAARLSYRMDAQSYQVRVAESRVAALQAQAEISRLAAPRRKARKTTTSGGRKTAARGTTRSRK